MRTVLVLGAGRSSSSLIDYLLRHAATNEWMVIVGDLSETAALERIGDSSYGQYVRFDINDETCSFDTIRNADLVISLLPAHFHPLVARHCLESGTHLFTASYVSPEMSSFDEAARSRDLLFLNECGLDPGIDHMSAMQIMDRIRRDGGTITSFESFTGGLIAPDTDTENPWRYKFTWNPRNVVMAGQGTAKYLEQGKLRYVPYQQLFKRTTPVNVPGLGSFEGYANRDSLKYIQTYGLIGLDTMLRGTLRHEGFCSAWNILVQLGCCDDSYIIENSHLLTHASFVECFLPARAAASAQEKLCAFFGLSPESAEVKRLAWSGFFSDAAIPMREATPAQITEHILNKRWRLSTDDRDMIVMWHRFGYRLHGKQKSVEASLVVKGHDAVDTAMAKTVGLPLAIAAHLMLDGRISKRGVVIPVTPDIYNPVLQALAHQGITMVEQES